jgi:hypothetical protein
MILNTLKIIGVAIGVMAVVLAIGYLYVMNEMREEIKKDRGVRMKKMIWAGMNPPSADDFCWATGNGYQLEWNMKVAEILQIKDHKVRAAKLRELADCLDAGIITTSRRVVRDLEKEVEA